MSPPQPRILMTTDAVGGVWTYASSLARALCARGHALTLVSMGPPPRPDQIAMIAGLPGLTFEVTDLALEWMDPAGDDIARARTVLVEIAERAAPHVVHLNSFREAAFGFDAPVLLVAHSCVGSWWQACRPDTPMEPRWQTYLRNVERGLDCADAWVAPTRSYARWIERHYGPAKRGDVIWNGATIPPSSTAKRQGFLAAGRLWDEAKNVRALTRIASALPWPLRIAGANRSPADEATEEIAGIEWLGELPHPALLEQMRHAAVFVAPALYEPFGLTILEAAVCGCALVLSDIPSLRELWNEAALFVDPRDDDGLLRSLQALARDEALRTRLQRKALERARRYSLAATVDDYRCLYERLATSLQPQAAVAGFYAGAGA